MRALRRILAVPSYGLPRAAVCPYEALLVGELQKGAELQQINPTFQMNQQVGYAPMHVVAIFAPLFGPQLTAFRRQSLLSRPCKYTHNGFQGPGRGVIS